VFDGAKQSPYVERDATAPLNVYGRSKAAAGRLVTGRAFPAADDVTISPTYVPDLVDARVAPHTASSPASAARSCRRSTMPSLATPLSVRRVSPES
jgi:dTDP-4-dehydrorhamnose reductase